MEQQQYFKLPFHLYKKHVELRALDQSRASFNETTRLPPYISIQDSEVFSPPTAPSADQDSHESRCDCVEMGSATCDENTCTNASLFIECFSENCSIGEHCGNRQLGSKGWARTRVCYVTGGKGFGLFAEEAIPSGRLVVEYVGEVIDREECQRRLGYFYQDDSHSYMFSQGKYVVDATRSGNVGRFINHSCEPNCSSQRWQVRGRETLGIFAVEDIPVGSEITIDYQFQKMGAHRQVCYCGAKLCKQFLDK